LYLASDPQQGELARGGVELGALPFCDGSEVNLKDASNRPARLVLTPSSPANSRRVGRFGATSSWRCLNRKSRHRLQLFECILEVGRGQTGAASGIQAQLIAAGESHHAGWVLKALDLVLAKIELARKALLNAPAPKCPRNLRYAGRLLNVYP
jgi:hypothetical protein